MSSKNAREMMADKAYEAYKLLTHIRAIADFEHDDEIYEKAEAASNIIWEIMRADPRWVVWDEIVE
jgi:hypothetical protein